MVRKETCPVCKGNKYISITRPEGTPSYRQCPACNGCGYRIRITHAAG
jgi:DnaJ-class molecular chaperone